MIPTPKEAPKPVPTEDDLLAMINAELEKQGKK
jgi:hypothetical protein